MSYSHDILWTRVSNRERSKQWSLGPKAGTGLTYSDKPRPLLSYRAFAGVKQEPANVTAPQKGLTPRQQSGPTNQRLSFPTSFSRVQDTKPRPFHLRYRFRSCPGALLNLYLAFAQQIRFKNSLKTKTHFFALASSKRGSVFGWVQMWGREL